MNHFGKSLCWMLLLSIALPSNFAHAQTASQNPSPQIRLEDLGFKNEDNQVRLELQKDRETRSSRLKLHQTMAFVTWGLMGATLALADKAKSGNIHQNLGMLTAASYFTTAYLSMSAPDPDKISGASGWNIKIHKALRWIHLPLMILVPIAGIQAERQNERHQAHTGLGKYKAGLGGALFATYTIAGSVMLFEF